MANRQNESVNIASSSIHTSNFSSAHLLEDLETEGRTIPSNINSPSENNIFDSGFQLNYQNENFFMYLNEMCNGEDNNFRMDDINIMINRNHDDNFYGYLFN